MFLSEDIVFASTCKYSTLILISFSSYVRWDISCFCWPFVDLRLSELTWLVLYSSPLFYMAATALYLSATTCLSYYSSTTFASFVWHLEISIFVERLSMRLSGWSLEVSISFEYLNFMIEILFIGCYWCFSIHISSSIFSRYFFTISA